MKTLFIASRLPWPLDIGTNIRTFNILKMYSSISKVTLVSFVGDDDGAEGVQGLTRYCEKIYVVPVKTCRSNRWKNNIFLSRWDRVFSITPLGIKKWFSVEMVRLIEKINLKEFQVIHVQRIRGCANILSIFSKRSASQKLIIDVDDYESKKLYREFKIGKNFKEKSFLFLEYILMLIRERLELRKFDLCLVCKKEDQKELEEKRIVKSVVVLPNGADTGQMQETDVKKNANSILYLGAMFYKPNNDAVLYFIKEIFPFIKRKVPDVRFVIAGKEPSTDVQALHNGQDVFVIGYVADAIKVMRENALFVVPMRLGGGSRIKILEAMAIGKAVVSTTIGCEGIEATSGENIAIADQPQDFAEKCIELLSSTRKRDEIGNFAKKFVEENYAWQKIGEKYSNYIKTVLTDCLLNPNHE